SRKNRGPNRGGVTAGCPPRHQGVVIRWDWLERTSTPGAHGLAQLIHGAQSALRHELNDPCDMGLMDRGRIGALLHHCCECGLELAPRAHAYRDDDHTQPRCRTL